MDDISRSLLREAERIHPRIDKGLEGTLGKVRLRRHRRRVAAGIVGLALPALVLALGWFAFRPSGGPQPADRSEPTPSPTPGAAAGSCDWIGSGDPAPDRYAPSTRVTNGDVDGDDQIDIVDVLTDETRPESCRFVLRVETGTGSAIAAAIAPLEWPGTAPEPLLLAELDGRPGVEIVLDLSPAAVYRPGAVFTVRDGELVRMELRGTDPADLFPLDDEFPAGVDCTANGAEIVVTTGIFADGGNDDGRWEITRTTYRARGTSFQPAGTEFHVVAVGNEMERWPELAGEPFRSCPLIVDSFDRTGE